MASDSDEGNLENNMETLIDGNTYSILIRDIVDEGADEDYEGPPQDALKLSVPAVDEFQPIFGAWIDEEPEFPIVRKFRSKAGDFDGVHNGYAWPSEWYSKDPCYGLLQRSVSGDLGIIFSVFELD
jgi:hypothetical protein